MQNQHITELKFSNWVLITAIIFPLVLFGSITDIVKQGLLQRADWFLWFLLAGFVAWILVWNFIRPGIYMIVGKPAIVLSTDWIQCNMNRYFIEWADISKMELEITTSRSGSNGTIKITVKDPWKYIGGISNPIIRNYRWAVNQYISPAFGISLSNVKGDKYDNYATVENYYHLYRNAQFGS